MIVHSFRGRSVTRLLLLVACASVLPTSSAAETGDAKTSKTSAGSDKAQVTRERLEVMTRHIESIVISSTDPAVPKRMQPKPLFRYDDETRGYVDGTVWRLGESGRPLAIITAELHPNYLGDGPRIVYDLLSFTGRRFTATSADIPGWSPRGPAVIFKELPDAPEAATVAAKRLTQLKEQARRFTGTQEVQETDKTFVHLRLLPREIERYSPGSDPSSDGALFVFANGRNPALLLAIETDGKAWQYGIGRLSMPSTLEMRLDDTVVWSEPRIPSSPGWREPYNASNSPAEFP
ncbi:MAG: hypothetical protein HY290_32540 [Planctomycetia bacterium]|nr:hypothetical protein [Planctomycetia bacterium]